MLVAKWDSLCKHASCKKALRNMGFDVKKKIGFNLSFISMPKTREHLHLAIGRQSAHWVVGEKIQKVVQFSIVLHLLQQGCPMLEYEYLKSLFEFLVVPKNNKKH
jgi:hypothetical protein